MGTRFLFRALALAALSWSVVAWGRPLKSGAVAAPDRYGARAAEEILRAGGNAVDAAIATAFVLSVTYPQAGNLGGGGFMTLLVGGKPYFLDYREAAPARASATQYLDRQGAIVPRLSVVGNMAVAVPGTVRGMAQAHRRFGKLFWARDLAPAIRLARHGFEVSPFLARGLEVNRTSFSESTNFERYFGALRAGRRFRQPELARTLQRLAAKGGSEFYRGRTARLIVAQMARGRIKGLITTADLSSYQAVWREPLQADWHGFRVITAPPPSSGGITLLQLLYMKEEAAALFRGVALNSAQYVHLVSEMEKRAFADRAEYAGDPGFVRVPVATLIQRAYVARRALEISPTTPSAIAAVRPGLEKPETTHFSIVDRWGNAVSNTYTLNGAFGAGVVVEGAGFLLNDEMDDFSARPGAPNLFGVVGGEANAIAPFKRPLSSMTPTILTRDGQIAMVIGTPGGSRIPAWLFQVLTDVYDFGLPLRTALGELRFHHQLLPENLIFFDRDYPFPADVAAELGRRGYRLESSFRGDVEAVQILRSKPHPASDPRGDGLSLQVP